MNNSEIKYNKYALCREMLETVDVIRNYTLPTPPPLGNKNKILFTGEGSSRIFPAKHGIHQNRRRSGNLQLDTEGSLQSMEYKLDDHLVLGSSNSGKTSELIRLFKQLKNQGHQKLYGLTANKNTVLEEFSNSSHVLNCGKEDAVAATKSVAEQALYIQSILSEYNGEKLTGFSDAADKLEGVLKQSIDPSIIEAISNADTIYFAGKNNGVAEELALKTNEITRKKSGYLEGTYMLHGIEEVLTSKDVIISVDPFESEEEKMMEFLVKGVGLKLITISARDTMFPNIKIPTSANFQSYLELAAGWNLLVETGLKLKVNLDKPVRARKVGNEFTN